MKPVGVFYATREGHTRRVAERVATRLRAHGLDVDVRNLAEGNNFDLEDYSAAVLAASVHAGRHESEMVQFAKRHRTQLDLLPGAFLSVTLSEARAERANASAEDHRHAAAEVQKMLDDFVKATGWHPKRMKPVAGALLYSKYNFLIRFIMKKIAKKSGGATDTSRDYEYTDWPALDRFADELYEDFARSERHTSLESSVKATLR